MNHDVTDYDEPDDRHLYAVPDDGYTQREPPNDARAEQAVLGAALTRPDTIPALAKILGGDAFHTNRHETIWYAARTLHDAEHPVDLISVTNQLVATGDLPRAGGGPYVHQLVTMALDLGANVGAENATYHAHTLANLARRRRIIAAGNRAVELGYALTADTDEAANQALDVIQAATAVTGPSTATTWTPVDLTPYLFGDEVIDSPAPTVLARTDGPCLLYRGTVSSIAGEPESGKTWVALTATAQELHQGHDVLYVDFEDRPARVVARLLAIGAHPAQVDAHFRYIRPEQALTAATAPHLAAAAAGTTVAVIDGITEAMTLHGLSLLDNEDVARWLALLPRRLANTPWPDGDLGPAVLQIDHVIKNSEQRGRYAIGGQHKLAGIDGCAYKIAVTESFGRGKRGHARITLDKDREGHVRAVAFGQTVAMLTLDGRETATHTTDQLRVHLDPPMADVDETTGGLRPTGLMEKVSKYLEVNPGATGGTIEGVIRGKSQYVRDAIRCLITEGYVRTEPAKRGATNHWSEKPYREDDDR